VALAEMMIAVGHGIQIDLERILSKCRRLDETLFSESHGRMLLSTSENRIDEIISLAERYSVPCSVLGRVRDQKLTIRSNGLDVISISLEEIKRVWEKTIPECMGEVL
jgi:phosphoribosylformylglycinamidine (FGAM) synthase-like enzyme